MTLSIDRIQHDYPAIWPGRVVTQAHADYCAEHGHATHKVDGVDTGKCPRCGEVKDVPATPDEIAGGYWLDAAEKAREAHFAISCHSDHAISGGKPYARSRRAFKAAIEAAYPELDASGIYGLWVDCMESVRYCASTYKAMDQDDRDKFAQIGRD